MENKTCLECRYFLPPKRECPRYNDNNLSCGDKACDRFVSDKPTNGDRIRKMTNRELAELITPKVMFCDGCPVKCAEKDIPQRASNDPFGADVAGDVCVKRVEDWLNSEVAE